MTPVTWSRGHVVTWSRGHAGAHAQRQVPQGRVDDPQIRRAGQPVPVGSRPCQVCPPGDRACRWRGHPTKDPFFWNFGSKRPPSFGWSLPAMNSGTISETADLPRYFPTVETRRPRVFQYLDTRAPRPLLPAIAQAAPTPPLRYLGGSDSRPSPGRRAPA